MFPYFMREKTDKNGVIPDVDESRYFDTKCHRHEFDFMLFHIIYENAFSGFLFSC